MTPKSVRRLYSLLTTVFLCHCALATEYPPRLRRDESVVSSVVYEEGKGIKFNLTVEGDPAPVCMGWFRDIESGRLEKEKKNDGFNCNVTQTESRLFELEIVNPTKSAISKYVIIFENPQGVQLFHFEVKGGTEWHFYVMITAIVVAGVVVIIIFIVGVSVCRRRCRRRRNGRRRRLQSNESRNNRRSPRRLSMTPFSRPSSRSRPPPPPKPPSESQDPPAPLPSMEGSKPCPCTGSKLHQGYVTMDSGLLYAEQAEIADAITTTLQRFRNRPRNNAAVAESSLLKSRRLSRSVPSLYNAGQPAPHLTLPSRRPAPYQPLPPGYASFRGGYRLPGIVGDDRKPLLPPVFPAARPSSGSAVDSGLAWEEGSEFTSVSMGEARLRRPLPLDEHSPDFSRFWRRSLVIHSAELGSQVSNTYQDALSSHDDDLDSDVDDTLRHSESKYVSMSGFYQGPLSLPNPAEFPDYPLPPPPPPPKPCGPAPPSADRPYQNLLNSCLHPYDPAGDNDDCEDCEQGFFCRQ